MINSIIMQNNTILGDTCISYTVIPALYNQEGKLVIKTPQEIKDLKKEFSTFEEALSYLKMLQIQDVSKYFNYNYWY